MMFTPSHKAQISKEKIILELRTRITFPFNKVEKIYVERKKYSMLEAEVMAVLWACIIAGTKDEINIENSTVKRFITELNIKKEGNIEILINLIKAIINYKKLKII